MAVVLVPADAGGFDVPSDPRPEVYCAPEYLHTSVDRSAALLATI